MSEQKTIDCPACSKAIKLHDGAILEELVCESCGHNLETTSKSEKGQNENAASSVVSPDETALVQAKIKQAIDMLPPQFLADDPDFVDYRVKSGHQQRILLPDSGGGVQSVDGNIVRIQHKGQTYELVALSPDQRRKRQQLINIVSIAVGAIFLFLFFRWLVR